MTGDEDSQLTFGREGLTDELLDRVRTDNFLAVGGGASGNGKSSVLRAGLLHQLKLGRRIAGSDQWRLCIARPDEKPLREFGVGVCCQRTYLGWSGQRSWREAGRYSTRSDRLAAAHPSGQCSPGDLRTIDQFEEVFTAVNKRKSVRRFWLILMGHWTPRGINCV